MTTKSTQTLLEFDSEGIAASRWADHLWQPKLIQLDDGRFYVDLYAIGELVMLPGRDDDRSYHFPKATFTNKEITELFGYVVEKKAHKDCEWLEGQDCWLAFI